MILKYDVEIIAQQFSLIDQQLFTCVTVSELLSKRWMDKQNKLKNSPTICKLTDRFNTIAQWVASVIVEEISIDIRVKILSRFICLARTLFTIGNFYGSMAILAGVDSSTITRLKRTWEVSLHFPLSISSFTIYFILSRCFP